MSDLNGVVGYARRWIELHRENKFQREAAMIMQRLADALESVRAERDAAKTEIERYKDAAEGNRIRLVHAQNDAERFEAERDAALAAIERVRAIHVRHKDTHKPDPSVINGNWFCCGAVQLGAVDPYACIACDSPEWPCPTIQALDGAPEPEWEYGREYVDEAGDPHIHTTQDVTSPDGHRADGSPYRNYQVVRRRKSGPWLPVEGEKP